MSAYNLVKAVKERTGIKSDNGIANLINRDRQNIYNWKTKNSMADVDAVLDLMIAGNIDAKEAKKLLESGFVSVSLLLVTSSVCIVGLALFSMFNKCILCKIEQIILTNSQRTEFT